jgi:UDP-glucuronate 4-epimerase
MAAMHVDFSGYEILNLGRGEPVTLNDLVSCIEKSIGKEAIRIYKHVQTGDVPNTHASIEKARTILNYAPKTSLAKGIDSFVEWYRTAQLEPTASA